MHFISDIGVLYVSKTNNYVEFLVETIKNVKNVWTV
jgi:hypothetical protein